MAKYRALSLLWDGINNRNVYPGELIELEGDAADILEKRGRIALAENEIEIEPVEDEE